MEQAHLKKYKVRRSLPCARTDGGHTTITKRDQSEACEAPRRIKNTQVNVGSIIPCDITKCFLGAPTAHLSLLITTFSTAKKPNPEKISFRRSYGGFEATHVPRIATDEVVFCLAQNIPELMCSTTFLRQEVYHTHIA